jgi:hypothetical protein
MATIQFILSIQKATARRPSSKWIDHGRKTEEKTSKETQDSAIIVGQLEQKVSKTFV